MLLRAHLPVTLWLWRSITGHIARRVYLAIVLVLLLATTEIRIHTYILTHRIEAVISGLSKLQIDETTEDEVLRTVPYLIRGELRERSTPKNETANMDQGFERDDYVKISNQPQWMRFEVFAWQHSHTGISREDRQTGGIFTLADLLGYRYIAFGAHVVIFNGKVSSLSYGIADRLVFPETVGGIVLVRSGHAHWSPRRMGFEVPSLEDESPQFDVEGNDASVGVLFMPEASAEQRSHAFQINLSCFWRLRGCRHAREVAPLLWQDKNTIEAAALARLTSGDPCPDRILAGRFKYLWDMDAAVLESNGIKSDSVNDFGIRVDEPSINYKLIEVLRGRALLSWASTEPQATIPYPGDYTRRLPNTGIQQPEKGTQVIAFLDQHFDSCRIVPATPSALSTARNTVPASRRAEDETTMGSM
jgi:hypothetical protein